MDTENAQWDHIRMYEELIINTLHVRLKKPDIPDLQMKIDNAMHFYLNELTKYSKNVSKTRGADKCQTSLQSIVNALKRDGKKYTVVMKSMTIDLLGIIVNTRNHRWFRKILLCVYNSALSRSKKNAIKQLVQDQTYVRKLTELLPNCDDYEMQIYLLETILKLSVGAASKTLLNKCKQMFDNSKCIDFFLKEVDVANLPETARKFLNFVNVKNKRKHIIPIHCLRIKVEWKHTSCFGNSKWIDFNLSTATIGIIDLKPSKHMPNHRDIPSVIVIKFCNIDQYIVTLKRTDEGRIISKYVRIQMRNPDSKPTRSERVTRVVFKYYYQKEHVEFEQRLKNILQDKYIEDDGTVTGISWNVHRATRYSTFTYSVSTTTSATNDTNSVYQYALISVAKLNAEQEYFQETRNEYISNRNIQASRTSSYSKESSSRSHSHRPSGSTNIFPIQNTHHTSRHNSSRQSVVDDSSPVNDESSFPQYVSSRRFPEYPERITGRSEINKKHLFVINKIQSEKENNRLDKNLKKVQEERRKYDKMCDNRRDFQSASRTHLTETSSDEHIRHMNKENSRSKMDTKRRPLEKTNCENKIIPKKTLEEMRRKHTEYLTIKRNYREAMTINNAIVPQTNAVNPIEPLAIRSTVQDHVFNLYGVKCSVPHKIPNITTKEGRTKHTEYQTIKRNYREAMTPCTHEEGSVVHDKQERANEKRSLKDKNKQFVSNYATKTKTNKAVVPQTNAVNRTIEDLVFERSTVETHVLNSYGVKCSAPYKIGAPLPNTDNTENISMTANDTGATEIHGDLSPMPEICYPRPKHRIQHTAAVASESTRSKRKGRPVKSDYESDRSRSCRKRTRNQSPDEVCPNRNPDAYQLTWSRIVKPPKRLADETYVLMNCERQPETQLQTKRTRALDKTAHTPTIQRRNERYETLDSRLKGDIVLSGYFCRALHVDSNNNMTDTVLIGSSQGTQDIDNCPKHSNNLNATCPKNAQIRLTTTDPNNTDTALLANRQKNHVSVPNAAKPKRPYNRKVKTLDTILKNPPKARRRNTKAYCPKQKSVTEQIDSTPRNTKKRRLFNVSEFQTQELLEPASRKLTAVSKYGEIATSTRQTTNLNSSVQSLQEQDFDPRMADAKFSASASLTEEMMREANSNKVANESQNNSEENSNVIIDETQHYVDSSRRFVSVVVDLNKSNDKSDTKEDRRTRVHLEAFDYAMNITPISENKEKMQKQQSMKKKRYETLDSGLKREIVMNEYYYRSLHVDSNNNMTDTVLIGSSQKTQDIDNFPNRSNNSDALCPRNARIRLTTTGPNNTGYNTDTMLVNRQKNHVSAPNSAKPRKNHIFAPNSAKPKRPYNRKVKTLDKLLKNPPKSRRRNTVSYCANYEPVTEQIDLTPRNTKKRRLFNVSEFQMQEQPEPVPRKLTCF